MKVSRPDSTCGRNASCCALLKRCTSSTKRMVARPNWSRASRARSTASRISFTPESTAEIAMKSALNACAINRASVVFPTPGGPHRIIECGLPARSATHSARPSPSRCSCPTMSWTLFGRSFSASGTLASPAPVKRSRDSFMAPSYFRGSLFPHHSLALGGRVLDDVGARGRSELERVGGNGGVGLEVGEAQRGTPAQLILEFHRGEGAALQPETHALAAGVLGLRCRLDPGQSVGGSGVVQREERGDVVLAREQRGGRGGDRLVDAFHGDLVQVRIVDPELGA